MSDQNLVHLGLLFPKETVNKIDERKGQYYSRNKYLLKIVEEHLNENENKSEDQKGVRGSTATNPATPSTPPVSPSTEARKTNSLINNWRSSA